MKKQILLFVMAALFGFSAVHAQADGGRQRMTPEERTTSTMEKLAPLSLSGDATTKTKTVFTDFYAAQQKAMEDMRASGGTPDRDAMMATRKKLVDERDTKLKEIFTADQFKKWKDEIEPSLRPQRARQ